MRFSQPLDDLFQNRSNVKVLRALQAIPEGVEVSTREVARRAGITHPTASAVLESLRTQGVVHARRTIWADQYRVNPEHVLWEKVRPLLKWERRLRDEVIAFLTNEVQERTPWASKVYLFGSAARDDMVPDSDIDIAVICPKRRATSAERAMEALSELSSELYGNRVNSVVGSRPVVELAKPGQPRYRLWRTIAKEGITLFPSEDATS